MPNNRPDLHLLRVYPHGGVQVLDLGVANRILGLLLAALAMETIINATGEIFQGAVGQLQEMGVMGR